MMHRWASLGRVLDLGKLWQGLAYAASGCWVAYGLSFEVDEVLNQSAGSRLIADLSDKWALNADLQCHTLLLHLLVGSCALSTGAWTLDAAGQGRQQTIC
jgi:hypothetical protein